MLKQILPQNLDIAELGSIGKNLYIFISQSGETADTFAALDLCKKKMLKHAQ